MARLMNVKRKVPWLGAVCRCSRNDDGTLNCEEIVHWTGKPFLAECSSEARKVLFAKAMRDEPKLDPQEVEVYVIPFSYPD